MKRWVVVHLIPLAAIVLAGLVAVNSGTAAAQDAAEARQNLSMRLAGLAFTRAGFRQERHLAALSRPLLSEGEVILERERRLKWAQTVPYPVTVLITPEEIREQVPGQKVRVITPRDNPLMMSVAQAYVALLEGDIEHLETLFSAQMNEEGDGWTLTLVPRQAAFAQAISQIRIDGAKVIREIRIEEQSGDWTRIELFDHQPPGAQ